MTTYLIFRGKHRKAQLVNHHQKFLKKGFVIQGFEIRSDKHSLLNAQFNKKTNGSYLFLL